MSLERFTYAERPDLAAGLEQEEAGAFPEFLLHDSVWNECFPQIIAEFPEQQFVLYDAEREVVVGGANAIPFRWNGTPEDLPAGTHEAMQRGLAERRQEVGANTVCGIQAFTTEEARGIGLGEEFVRGGRIRAAEGEFEHWLTPLRLLLKDRYPLTPLEEYVEWRRRDGALFDPWLRVWARAGAMSLGVAHDALVIKGTVAEWEEWTGLELPASGEFVISGGQVPLRVDRERDLCRYSESHLWMEAPIEG